MSSPTDETLRSKLPVFHKNLPVTIHTSLLVALLALVWASAVRVSRWEARLDILEDITEHAVEDHYKLKYISEQLTGISKQIEDLSK